MQKSEVFRQLFIRNPMGRYCRIRKNNLNYNGKQKDKKAEKYKDLYIKMLIVNAVLIVTIIVMFVITKTQRSMTWIIIEKVLKMNILNGSKTQERESALAESEK